MGASSRGQAISLDETYNEWLHQQMSAQGFKSLRQLSLASGVSAHTLSNAFSGSTEMGVLKAYKVAQVLKTTVDEMIKHGVFCSK